MRLKRPQRNWSIVAVRAALCMLAAGALAACKVLETRSLHTESGEYCRTATGAYFLPKSQIKLVVTQTGAAPYDLTVSDPVSYPDRDQIFCLDYLASAFAEDKINVIRESGLLAEIKSVNTDKSKDVALYGLEIGMIAATGNPNIAGLRRADFGETNGTVTLADYDLDPFDRAGLADINTVLASTYGYCLVIDGHTLDLRGVQNYCSNPRGYTHSRGPGGLAEPLPPLPSEEMTRGILYRPNQTHQLMIFRRTDPKAKARWQLHLTRQIEMPNVSPIFSVGVERSLFVERSTQLIFDKGVLKDIRIEKPSELLEFIEIPLRVVQAVVKVPAAVVKVRIAAVDNNRRLIDAQRELILTNNAAAQLAQTRSSGTTGGTPNRSINTAMAERLGGQRSLDSLTESLCNDICQPGGDGADLPGCANRCPSSAQSCPTDRVARRRCISDNLGVRP